jgi:hypothetical protein
MGKSLRKASKGFKNRGRWDEGFKDDQFQIPGKATKIRLFDEFDTIPHHWVEFYSNKKKGMTGFYALCQNWDYEEGEYADNGCPYCEADLRVTNYTYGFVISRKEQRQGNLQVRPIRLTPKCTSDILNLTESAYPDEEYPEEWEDEDGEGPDATHPKFGFDITIKVGKKNNKTEYTVSYADNGKCPLKKSELKAFQDAAEQIPFAELALAGLETKEEAARKLKELGVLDGGSSEPQKKKSSDYNDYDEDDDDEVPDDEDEKPKSSKPAKKKAKTAKKVTAIPDDDDDEDDRSLPWDDEDDDDEDGNERAYADDDEDDAPDDEDDED